MLSIRTWTEVRHYKLSQSRHPQFAGYSRPQQKTFALSPVECFEKSICSQIKPVFPALQLLESSWNTRVIHKRPKKKERDQVNRLVTFKWWMTVYQAVFKLRIGVHSYIKSFQTRQTCSVHFPFIFSISDVFLSHIRIELYWTGEQRRKSFTSAHCAVWNWTSKLWSVARPQRKITAHNIPLVTRSVYTLFSFRSKNIFLWPHGDVKKERTGECSEMSCNLAAKRPENPLLKMANGRHWKAPQWDISW